LAAQGVEEEIPSTPTVQSTLVPLVRLAETA
jgi:hypothetical protein